MLGKLARQHDPNVLVGFEHADDAGVYQIAPDQALVQTVDFFTPIVDDPYTFGQIAATNSLSDIYAMGARPVTALALVCFPEKGELEILGQILSGGLSKMIEAGCTVIGGHSIRDEETKFGYSVTGLVRVKHVLKNGGARPGDRLLLTKPLGTGAISTAIKKGAAKPGWIEAAVQSMTTLNKTAAEVLGEFRAGTPPGSPPSRESTDRDFPIHALTDVTGFGLIGHLREMLAASERVSAKLYASRVPVLPGALECVHAGHIPGGGKANREFLECLVAYGGRVADDLRTILFDPQTAGGLLVAVAAERAPDVTNSLERAGVSAVEIGEVFESTKLEVEVAP